MVDCSDWFVGYFNFVDVLLKVDEDMFFMGLSDGIICIVSILLNKMIGVIGEYVDFFVECFVFLYDWNILGSVFYDNILKFWDVKYLYEDDDVDEDVFEVNVVLVGVFIIIIV